MGPRRTHRKSRNGCPECKARRLKCDERYPCTNCVKHATPCSYRPPADQEGTPRATPMSSASPAAQSQSRAQPDVHPQPPTNSGYPENSFHGGQHGPENRLNMGGLLPSSPQDISILNTDDWGLDLELMHHYCTVTCNTMALREDSRHVWRVVIPTEGYANKYVMHGILAVAAVHRADLYPEQSQKEKYSKASAYHLATGLTQFRNLIASPIDPNNWQPVFCFASMINVHLTASPIRFGMAQWPAPISNMVELFASVRGFQVIMEPFIKYLQKTQLAPLVNSIWLESDYFIPSPSIRTQSLLPADTWTQISRLHHFIDEYPFPEPPPQSDQRQSDPETDEEPPSHRKDYKVALKFFEHATRQLELAGPHVESGMVFLWAYPLSKQFHEDVEAYHPAALVLLAHYCVLLHTIDHFWYINGIGRQLLEDIESKMHPGFREWLTWPRKWVLQR